MPEADAEKITEDSLRLSPAESSPAVDAETDDPGSAGTGSADNGSAGTGSADIGSADNGSVVTDADTGALSRRRDALGPSLRSGGVRERELVSGEGAHLVDAAGTDYLDADVDAVILGQSSPRVVDAIVSAASAPRGLHHGLDRASIELGERLVATLPDDLARVMFTSGHSAAVDLALRIIRSAGGGRGVIVTRSAYHGSTSETAALSPALIGRAGLPGWVRVVDPPTGDGTEFCDRVAATALALRDSEYGLAGLIVDPSFSTDTLAVSGSIARAADAVRAAGGFVLADESQSGLGRLGSDRWGFEAARFSPDAVILGTSIANGLPLAAVVTNPALASAFASMTRSASSLLDVAIGAAEGEPEPVAVAAALAVLDTIESGDLQSSAGAVGEYLRQGLALLGSAFAVIGDVRGRGLLLAVDAIGPEGAPAPATASAIAAELDRRGVLVGRIGHVLTVRPPLVFSIADADRLLSAAYAALLATDPALEITQPKTAAGPADAVGVVSDASAATPASRASTSEDAADAEAGTEAENQIGADDGGPAEATADDDDDHVDVLDDADDATAGDAGSDPAADDTAADDPAADDTDAGDTDVEVDVDVDVGVGVGGDTDTVTGTGTGTGTDATDHDAAEDADDEDKDDADDEDEGIDDDRVANRKPNRRRGGRFR